MDLEGAREQQREQQDEAKAAPRVKPFHPKLDPGKSYSLLNRREMRICANEIGIVDLKLQNPESSAWLKGIFRELEDRDPETRYYALCRFSTVLRRTVLKGPMLNASFSAYVLEQGILKEIIRILKSAKTEGDVYLVARGNIEEALYGLTDGVLVVSKVLTCFSILNGLMADARTWRFVKKSIPDLLFIFEGSYLSEQPIKLRGRRGQFTPLPHVSGLREREKIATLDALGGFALWATDEVREVICSRKDLLHQIVSDCLNNADLASVIVDRVITTTSVLASLSRGLPIPPDDFFKVAIKAFEVSQNPEVIKLAINLLAAYLKERPASLLKKKKLPSKYSVPLLVLATCSSLEDERKDYVHKLLCFLDQRTFNSNLARADYKAELEQMVAGSRKAAEKRQQLCDLFKADRNRQPTLQHSPKDANVQMGPLPSDRRTDYVTLATEDEMKSQRKPCRKCSRTDCSKTESASGEFKLCSKCRLAIYCSQGDQVNLCLFSGSF